MAYKVEFAKFNIMNAGVGGVGTVNGNDGAIMPTLSTITTTSGSSELHQIHHQMINNDDNSTTTSYVENYNQRIDFADVTYGNSQHHPFPSNMYSHHHQGSSTFHQQQLQQNFSPLSNTSNTGNEQQSNYQAQQQQQTDISNSSPLSHHPYHSDIDETNGTEESPYLVSKTSSMNSSATIAPPVYYHYPDSLHYNIFQIPNNHSYYDQQHDFNPPPPVYQPTQHVSMYETASRYPSSFRMFHNQQMADLSSSTIIPSLTPPISTSATSVCRGMHTDVTGVVYTTLTECRYVGDNNQALNLPTQYSSSANL